MSLWKVPDEQTRELMETSTAASWPARAGRGAAAGAAAR